MNPGTGGNQYNVAFNVAASGLGILTPDPNFYWNTFAGMTFYYNPADTLLYLSASDTNAQSIGAGLVKVCLVWKWWMRTIKRRPAPVEPRNR